MSELHHDDVRFEPTDVKALPIVWFLVFLFGLIVVVMVALWWTQNYLVAYETSIKRPGNSLAVLGEDKPTLPPEPRIEGIGLDKPSAHSVNRRDLPTSIATIRAEEATALKDGWTDAAGGKHPPVDEAIRQVVAKFGGKK